LDGRLEEYRQLDKLRRQALRQDKAEWPNRVAKDAEENRQHEGCVPELPTVNTIPTEHLRSYHFRISPSSLSQETYPPTMEGLF